jgi:hypothetical protein
MRKLTDKEIGEHLKNFSPPVPASMIPYVRKAVQKARAGRMGDVIHVRLPRHADADVPVAQIVADLNLQEFVGDGTRRWNDEKQADRREGIDRLE